MSSQSADLSAGLHPFSFSWDTTGYQGAYTLTVKLSNSSGSSVSSSVNVTVFFISQSADLWWFGGSEPSNYSVVITLTVNGITNGTFVWTVTGDKARFFENMNLYTSRTYTNVNTVNVRSVGSSNDPNDVTIHLSINGSSVANYYLTVFAPKIVQTNGPNDVSYMLGYKTTYDFLVHDQFGGDLPAEVPTNESFGAWTKDYSPCWGWNFDNPNGVYTADGGYFNDSYKVSFVDPISHPSTVHPTEPGWTTGVIHADQTYCVGGLTSGVGLAVQTRTIQLCRGKARQL
jgi:hypothetical protein